MFSRVTVRHIWSYFNIESYLVVISLYSVKYWSCLSVRNKTIHIIKDARDKNRNVHVDDMIHVSSCHSHVAINVSPIDIITPLLTFAFYLLNYNTQNVIKRYKTPLFSPYN